MSGLSASNVNYASKSSFGEVSFFYGQLVYDTAVSAYPEVTIIKQVTRDEQTKIDGTITRIETGRQLIISYDGTGGSKTQTVTLQGSLAGLVMSLSTTVLASYMLAF